MAKGARRFLTLLLALLAALVSQNAVNFVGNLGALVTAPYRFVRLASVTKACSECL